MKKITFTFLAIVFFSTYTFSQRFVYVDTEYILENIPEYQQAQREIDRIADEWKNEVDKRYKEIDDMYRAYQAEQVLLPEEMKIQKQKEIENKEKSVKDYQKRKFGYEGELFQKKQELIKPVQDRVYNEIQKMATEKTYDFIFDKSSGVSMLFASPKYDKSDDILKGLGYNPLSIQENPK